MSDIEREWTADEILGELPDWKDDPSHRAYWVELAEHLAECTQLWAAWGSLFAAIEHGDAEHRAWLKDKLDAWYSDAMRKPEGGE